MKIYEKKIDQLRALKGWSDEKYDMVFKWVSEEILPREKHLEQRCTYLYGKLKENHIDC